MRTVAQRAGAEAEALVAAGLRDRGWTILGRNVRVGRAEIDILAVDPGTAGSGPHLGGAGRPWLVAVEVRWRTRRDFGLAEETVDRTKLARLRAAVLTLRDGERAAGAATRGHHLTRVVPDLAVPRLAVRVDVVAVEPRGAVRHHRAVG